MARSRAYGDIIILVPAVCSLTAVYAIWLHQILFGKAALYGFICKHIDGVWGPPVGFLFLGVLVGWLSHICAGKIGLWLQYDAEIGVAQILRMAIGGGVMGFVLTSAAFDLKVSHYDSLAALGVVCGILAFPAIFRR